MLNLKFRMQNNKIEIKNGKCFDLQQNFNEINNAAIEQKTQNDLIDPFK